MKRILFMAAIVLNFSACDNTKIQLRAPESDNNTAVETPKKADTAKSSVSSVMDTTASAKY